MSLSLYKKKRNFTETPEPKAKKEKRGNKLSFVIQRHKATRLHYDFRLEIDGVLKSWAVPKGPSLNPSDKRLAMMVEDHPLDYKDFSGVIPEGNYGAGIVEIWDKGFYEPMIQDDKKSEEQILKQGLKSGDLKIVLHGKKLKGEFALIKLKNDRFGENSWLLIKHKDKFSVSSEYDSETKTPKTSPINKWLEKNKSSEKSPRRGALIAGKK
jgi:bifunctional non-homologous end joining protein LigD